MKAITLLAVLGLSTAVSAQRYCQPVVDPNSGDMRIIEVELNDLQRISPNWEAYVETGDTTTLKAGEDYPIRIRTNVGSFCPETDMRVYIDFNGDYDFDDPGEEAAAWDGLTSGKYSDTIKVPDDAVEGYTRMRIMNKMIEACGHSKIDPCATDPNWYHGEVEDYTVNIEVEEVNTSVEEAVQLAGEIHFVGQRSFKLTGWQSETVQVVLVDLQGRILDTQEVSPQSDNMVRWSGDYTGVVLMRAYDNRNVQVLKAVF